jgi:hypothetical protein
MNPIPSLEKSKRKYIYDQRIPSLLIKFELSYCNRPLSFVFLHPVRFEYNINPPVFIYTRTTKFFASYVSAALIL